MKRLTHKRFHILDVERVSEIIPLIEQGMKYRTIGLLVNRKERTIEDWVKRLRKAGYIINVPIKRKGGRPELKL